MKDVYYFPHDYNSRNDLKIQALLDDFGPAGYGLFWGISEILHEEEDHYLELNQFTFKAIAKQMSASVEQVEAVVKACLTYGLFIENGNNNFYSIRVNENIGKRAELSQKRSKAGKISAEKRSNLTSVEQPLTSVQQNSTKERKGKERKEKDNKENKEILFKESVFSFSDYPADLLNAFFNYWSEHDKAGRMKWEKEKTWELKKRLEYWQRTSNKFNKKPEIKWS